MQPQKDSYDRHGNGRHSSFRTREDSDSTGIPAAKWLLLMMILAAVVLGYENLRERGDAPHAPPPAALALQQEDVDAAPEAAARQAHEAAAPAEPPAAEAEAEPESQEAAPAPPEPGPEMVSYEMEKRAAGFVGAGKVNGQPVTLLADTGSSHVVIPEAVARRLGLQNGAPMEFSTAGGTVTHYATTIDKLTLGGIEIQGVNAVINPAMRNDFILLGMDVLGLLSMKMENSKLVLQHPANRAAEDAAAEGEGDGFRRSAKECARRGNTFDQRSLECLRGK